MPKKIKQAVILGAGLGTRLRPLTNEIPKVMLPIADDKPLLEHTIEFLKRQNITDFIINLHYLPEKIISYFGKGEKLGVNITYSDETGKLMDTAGAIKKVEKFLDDDFLFLYGDELNFLDFLPAISVHQKNNALATIILKRDDLPQNGDLAEINLATGKIIGWRSRPHLINEYGDKYFLNSGLYVLSKKIADFIPADRPVKLDGEIIPDLISKGIDLFGFISPTEILDIGTPEKYEFAKKYYSQVVKNKNFSYGG